MFVRGRAVAWAFVAVDLSPVFACGTGIAEAWLAGAGLVVAIDGGLLNKKTLAPNAKAPRHTHRTMSSQTLRNVFDMPCVWRVSQDVGGVKPTHVNYCEARVFFLLPSMAEVSLGRLGWTRGSRSYGGIKRRAGLNGRRLFCAEWRRRGTKRSLESTADQISNGATMPARGSQAQTLLTPRLCSSASSAICRQACNRTAPFPT